MRISSPEMLPRRWTLASNDKASARSELTTAAVDELPI
jgi:hypothetical protein